MSWLTGAPCGWSVRLAAPGLTAGVTGNERKIDCARAAHEAVDHIVEARWEAQNIYHFQTGYPRKRPGSFPSVDRIWSTSPPKRYRATVLVSDGGSAGPRPAKRAVTPHCLINRLTGHMVSHSNPQVCVNGQPASVEGWQGRCDIGARAFGAFGPWSKMTAECAIFRV